MAVSNAQELRPYKAGADLSAVANQYKIVKFTAASTIGLAAAATDKLIGVLQNRPQANVGAAVAVAGRALVKAGAAVAVGDRLTADASGRAIATTTAQNAYIGVAVTACSNADEIIEVELQHGTV